jgi:hypothetical protein
MGGRPTRPSSQGREAGRNERLQCGMQVLAQPAKEPLSIKSDSN